MKNLFLPFLLLTVVTPLFSQTGEGKVSYDKRNDVVSDESNVPLFKLVAKRNASTLMEYSIQSIGGTELFYVSSKEYNDPQEVSSANPDGRTIYLIYNFFALNSTAETKKFISKEKLAQYIYDEHLVTNEALDVDATNRFVQITGTPFTDRQKVINTPSTIIIQNNNSPAKSGVNVNINLPH